MVIQLFVPENLGFEILTSRIRYSQHKDVKKEVGFFLFTHGLDESYSSAVSLRIRRGQGTRPTFINGVFNMV